MALALAQTPVVGGTAAAATSVVTAALAGTPTANNLLVIGVQISDNATTITTPSGYTLLGGAIQRNGSSSTAVYYKVAGAGEPTTATISYGSSANAEAVYSEISGNSTTTPVETALTASALGTSVNPSVTGAAATTDATEMLVCIVGTLGKPTHSLPLDSASLDVSGTSAGGTATTGAGIAFMHKVLSANETPTMGDTLSVSRNWGAWVFAVKAASGGTAWTQSLADTVTATDAAAKAATLAKLDTVTGVDDLVKQVTLSRADTLTGTDATAKSITLLKLDTVTGTDAVTHVWVILRSFSDTVTAAEVFTPTSSAPSTNVHVHVIYVGRFGIY